MKHATQQPCGAGARTAARVLSGALSVYLAVSGVSGVSGDH